MGINFVLYDIKKLDGGKFGLRKDVTFHFPYYTFEDENYNKLMIQILISLDYRFYRPNQVIADEL